MSLGFTPVLESGLVLIPGNKHTLKLIFENDTEYDKQLFCTLRSPDGLRLSKNHFDVLVPAEGKCIEQLSITVPEELRIFYESYFFALETTDAVLEEGKNFAFFLKCALPWKWQSQNGENTSSGKIYMGSAHACSCTAEGSCAAFTITAFLACANDATVDILVNCDSDCDLFLNSTPLGSLKTEDKRALSLVEGINTVSITTTQHNTSITAEFLQNSDYIPACINPDSL